MNRRWLWILLFVALGTASIRAQQQHDPTSIDHGPPNQSPEFLASTDKPFDQLMDDAISAMHRGMHDSFRSGDPDHDFVTLMIPHHQGAIDMAKVLLLDGNDERLRRLAQEIITDQQNEIELMQLWLTKHPHPPRTGAETSSPETHR